MVRQRNALTGGAVRPAFLILFLGCTLAPSFAAQPSVFSASQADRLLARVNEVRGRHRLLALRPRRDLARVARAHARDMARRGYLAHVDPRGRNPLDRVRAAGIQGFKLLGENIAASSESQSRISRIVEEWMASPEHRENLLNPAFNTSGVAWIEGTARGVIAVQLYATFPNSDTVTAPEPR